MVNQRQKVIDKINRDLNIKKCDSESNESYELRIIYSSLAIWIRMAAYSIVDDELIDDNIGKSKKSIVNKVNIYFKNMIELFPELRMWFYPKDELTNPISAIVNRLVECGELVKVGFKTNLSLPKFEQCYVANNKYVYKGINFDGYDFVSGLIPFYYSSGEETTKKSIFSFYGTHDKKSSELLSCYLKNAKWKNIQQCSYQIFDKHCTGILSKCWKDEYQLSESDITIYKNDFYDFGFIKKKSDKIFISQINEYLIKKNEVRRFMYAIKYNQNNPAIASYKINYSCETVELNLFSALPYREESLLFLFGWPKYNIMDKYNFYFNKSIWPFIEQIIENLGIVLEEKR